MQRISPAFLSLVLLLVIPAMLPAQQEAWADRLVILTRHDVDLEERCPERFGPMSQRLRAHTKDMDTTLYLVVRDASYSSR